MQKIFLRKPVVLIFLFYLLLSYLLNFQDKKWENNLVHADGLGYYYYLPTLFNSDFSYQTTLAAEKKLFGENHRKDLIAKVNDTYYYNKCYPGLAVLQLPFYLIALGISSLFHLETNGFTPLFLFVFHLGSIFYSFLGIYFAKKLLDISVYKTNWNWLAVFAIYFGTNLIYISVASSSFTHHYSFTLIVLFCYFFIKYCEAYRLTYMLILSFVFGLIFLVRPINLIVVFLLPFLSGSKINFIHFLKQIFTVKNKHLVFSGILFFAVSSLLLVFNKIQTNQWFFWSYSGEGFNFAKPQIFATLFSFRAGIIIHYPILILASIGLFYLFKKNRFQFYAWFFASISILYFISSWWCWDYKYSFGNRAITDFYLLFIFPFAYFLNNVSKKLAVFTTLICLIFIGSRIYQKKEGILLQQKFTSQTYFKSMFDFTKTDFNKYNFLENIVPYGKLKAVYELKSNETEAKLDKNKEFACETKFYFPKKRKTNSFYFEITFEKKLFSETNANFFLIFDGINKTTGVKNYYKTEIFEHYLEAKSTWKKMYISDIIGAALDDLDELTVFLWNPEKKNMDIRNFNVKVTEYSN